jgi:hypothetical protein
MKNNPLRHSLDNRKIPIRARYFGNETDVNNQMLGNIQIGSTPKLNQDYKDYHIQNNFVDKLVYD